MGLLETKCLVVIGGTSGMGLSAAQAFAREGARVVAVGRDEASVAEASRLLGEQGWAWVGDATRPEVAAEAVQKCRERFGGFHGLFHVAGGSGRRLGDGPAHTVTDEAVDFTLNLNLKSVIYSNRAAVRAFMETKRSGSILNMGSVLGFSASPAFFATHVYAAAKEGIVGFSRAVAAYYAPHGIRVNVLASGLVDTPMSQRAAASESIRQFIKTKQPLDGGRIARPEDLNAAAVFFMSDGSLFCTGQVLAVDGGWCVSEGQIPAAAPEKT